jgi:hypothetical protein
MSSEVTQRSGWKCLFESAQPSHSFGIPGSSDWREASEARFLLLAFLFLECRDLPLNGLRGCNVCWPVRQPLQSYITAERE